MYFIKYSILITCLFLSSYCRGQYPPPAGYTGTTAIHKDSANWVCWANAATLQAGYKDISNPSLGLVNMGLATAATGVAGEGATVSLGDGGMITLQFPYPIQNGTGPDFAVFENAFSHTFLELAFVEVSSDGQHFVRFPAISETDTNTQVNSFGAVDATKIHNLAGKYRANYGTPFDLEELVDSAGIDLQNITHIRLIDVVGSIDPSYARRDSRGIIINDPWPTPFDSGGFDVDAVGVLNANAQSAVVGIAMADFRVYPNPISNAENRIRIDFGDDAANLHAVEVYNLHGQLLLQQQLRSGQAIATTDWSSGIYIVRAGQQVLKVVKY